MCAIIGIYAYYSVGPCPGREELRHIRNYMAVRRLDGKGEWYAADDRIALPHRCLAIIDLTYEAVQIMTGANVNQLIKLVVYRSGVWAKPWTNHVVQGTA